MKSVGFNVCLATVILLLTSCAVLPTRGDRPDGRYCVMVAKKTACTESPAPTAEQEAKAKQFAAESGKHIVWLIRNATFDSRQKWSIAVAGKKVETLPYTLSRVIVQPGRHSVALDTSRGTSEFFLDAVAGEQTFVELVVQFGLVRTTVSLRHVSAEVGRPKALAARLINDIRLQ